MTVVLVTHEPDIAEYAGRVITMRDGLVRADERQARRQPLPRSRGAPAAAVEGRP